MDVKVLETGSSAFGPSAVRCSVNSLTRGLLASAWLHVTLVFLGHSYFLWSVTKICSNFFLQSLLNIPISAVFCLSCLRSFIEAPFYTYPTGGNSYFNLQDLFFYNFFHCPDCSFLFLLFFQLILEVTFSIHYLSKYLTRYGSFQQFLVYS